MSIGTVSRVLNGSNTVGEELRAKVLDTIRQLDFEPNAAAQSMRRRTTLTVGCIVREIVIPAMAEFARSSQRVLEKAGYSLLLSNSDGRPETEIQLIKRMHSRQIDGIMLGAYSSVDQQFDDMLKNLGIPIVVVDRDKPFWADAVVADHAKGLQAATEHLLDLGHERIALLTGQPQILPARERIRGYRAAFEKRGLKVDEKMIHTGSFLSADGFRTSSMILGSRTPPTAIIAGGIEMLSGVIRAVRARNLSIPDDISIIGAGQSELAEFHVPAISIEGWDHGEMGSIAASLLLDRMLDRVDAEPRHVVLPTTFTARGSTSLAKN
ncbi:MAG: LacI family DNA-binding transcriptional regulator [Rhizobiaceae bacterium]|nr:LacI family DNA-binding transcriptional regulator [Rhizobiaceae bacterium]